MNLSSSLPLVLLMCLMLQWPDITYAADGSRLLAMIRSKRFSTKTSNFRLTQTTALEGGSPRSTNFTTQTTALEVKSHHIYIGAQDGLMEADKIEALPGQPKGSFGFGFDQYAGYVTVDPQAGRVLFYYFAEAPQPSKKPLVLWLNGGPGCSSLGGGAMLELGPFHVNSDGKTLYKNEHSWNNVANIIYLESPAGVGFSYSNRTSDYKKSGDKRTTDDTYTFLLNWLERFPHYKNRDFFITGESYAGFYIPNLAVAILAGNNAPINFKGIAIGNGHLDDEATGKGQYSYSLSHALISGETYRAIMENCRFKDEHYTKPCEDALNLAYAETGPINYYNIYASFCSASNESYAICSDLYINSYLNLPEVQKALHANTTRLNYPWSLCSSLINSWDESGSPRSMLPTIKQIIARNISVWLYSGDLDSVVPVTSTQYALDILGLPVETAWRPWYTNSEVAGYTVGYKGLVFATVRGAGHMVPYDQPERSLTMFSSFIRGKLPS